MRKAWRRMLWARCTSVVDDTRDKVAVMEILR
jgi:hypothetical protein